MPLTAVVLSTTVVTGVRSAAWILLAVSASLIVLAQRALTSERRRGERQGFLHEMAGMLHASHDVEGALQHLLDRTRAELHAGEAILLVRPDEDRPQGRRFVAGGHAGGAAAPPGRTDRSMLWAVCAGRTEVGAIRGETAPELALLEALGTLDVLVAPLRAENELLGALAVAGPRRASGRPRNDDLDVLRSVAAHASVALDNERLERSLAELTRMKLDLRRQTLHDSLTALPNRTLLIDRVGQALARQDRVAGTVSLMFIDLDSFKDVNDGLGHAAGDTVLKEVSTRLRTCMRGADTAARLGGDEFAVLLDGDSSLETALTIGRRIVESLGESLVVGGRRVQLGASVGLARCGAGELDADALLSRADAAMYAAKARGKGRLVVFEPDMGLKANRRVRLAAELDLAAEAGQLLVLHQPIVDLASGRMVATEALVRWSHPERGLLAPRDFLPLAEETGAILDIGYWVLGQACRDAAAWPQPPAGLAPTVSVNLSQRQLLDGLLVDRVREALEASGLAPERLILEVTEASIGGEEPALLAELRRIEALGVRLALDDFGLGHSSLGRLSSLPISLLKVPRPFIDQLDLVGSGPPIVEAILGLADSLGLTTIAEGVETRGQRQLLRELGCSLAQGFLFARPLPATDIATWGHAADSGELAA